MTHRSRPAPRERLPDSPALLNLDDECARLRAETDGAARPHHQKTIFKSGGVTIAIFAMEADASLPEHAAQGTVCVQTLDGRLELTVEGETHTVGPGSMLVMPPGMRHSVRALERSAFLLQVHKPTT